MFYTIIWLFAGNETAGTYKEYLKASAIDTCAIQCCIQKSECNVAFVFNDKCFHVKCKSNEQCMPLERTNMETKLKMVLVNPVAPGKLALAYVAWAQIEILLFNSINNDKNVSFHFQTNHG